MKRGGELRRVTPIPRPAGSLPRSSPRPRQSRLRPVRDEAREGAWADLRGVLYARARGLCERCGADLDRAGMDAHHRRLRSQGGRDDAVTCVALCPECHRHVHANPAEAKGAGWLVQSYEAPANIGLVLWDKRSVFLAPDGGYVDVPDLGGAA